MIETQRSKRSYTPPVRQLAIAFTVALAIPLGGCAAKPGVRVNVRVAEPGTDAERGIEEAREEAREDRHSRAFGDRRVIVYADPELRGEVERFFDSLVELEVSGAKLADGMKIPLGWTTLTLSLHGRDSHVFEPNYAADPERELREDISVSLRILLGQQRVLTDAGIKGESVDFDEHVLVAPGALDAPSVYLVRVVSPGGRMTGWRVAINRENEDEVSPEGDIDSLPVHVLLKRRPALLAALLLPPGYMAFFELDEIVGLVNPNDELVWSP
jgi:hypothetical protein